MTKTIFCANCQAETDHEITISSKEVLAVCACNAFVKFPAYNNAALFRQHIDTLKVANQGQVKAGQPIAVDPEVAAALENA